MLVLPSGPWNDNHIHKEKCICIEAARSESLSSTISAQRKAFISSHRESFVIFFFSAHDTTSTSLIWAHMVPIPFHWVVGSGVSSLNSLAYNVFSVARATQNMHMGWKSCIKEELTRLDMGAKDRYAFPIFPYHYITGVDISIGTGVTSSLSSSTLWAQDTATGACHKYNTFSPGNEMS